MDNYLLLKLIHVVSSVVLVGTGFGSAFYLFFINRTHNLPAQLEVVRLVVRADWWFTTPTVLIQPFTGILLAKQMGYSLTTGWLLYAIILYGFAGICWLPVVWWQIQMQKIAEKAVQNEQELPLRYWQLAHRWECLGYPAFIAMLGIFYLMIFKPLF